MFLITVTLFPMLVLCSITFLRDTTLYEGDRCRNINPNGGRFGRCLSAHKCSWGGQQIQKGQNISAFNFSGNTLIICCPLNQIKEEDNEYLDSAVTTAQNSTERYNLQVSNRDSSEGTLSRAKCLEYHPRPSWSSGSKNNGVAVIETGSFAAGGVESRTQEFPHMAALGFGETADKQWKCGGSLISLQHVLTAAHCLYARGFGKVKYVRLGDLNLAIDTDPAEPQDFNVKRAIAHPYYDSKTKKNDIAVIELDRPVLVTEYVKPACLYVGGEIDTYKEITATGWGIMEFAGSTSNFLMKVNLKIIDKDDCRKQYLNAKRKWNIDDTTVCAGSADDEKIMDTCEGDSGGPLQIANYTYGRHYHIVGITSFGKPCGLTKSAGIYSRVSFHLPWIESVVFNS